ncbi:MAG TPA: HD domain-containing protein [Bryobacteraceae bacterium]|nr:HD domain-containing protein [Bryobacteraceae bacterium]
MSLPDFPRTAAVDRLIAESAIAILSAQLNVSFALVAVGGYGRGELFPFSDVDLLLLLEQEPDPTILKEPLSQFLRLLWDSSLKLSHSVRTLDECVRYQPQNPHLHISLLDARFLYGDSALFAALKARLPVFYGRYAPQLLANLADLAVARHAKFDGTVYHLEPNIKEGPGGIRDIHFLQWASQLDPRKELFRHGVQDVSAAKEFYYRLRFFLHEKADRDNNLLSFELQDLAAASLPVEPTTPEAWMRTFYQYARICFRAAQQVLDSIERQESGLVRQFFDRGSKLSAGDFTVSHRQVFLRHPAQTLHSVEAMSDLFLFVGRQGIPCSWDTFRRLRERVESLAPASPATTLRWPTWSALLSQPHTALALRNMQDGEVLSAALPEWKQIESLVVRDFYHRYTVDEHTLVTLEAIDHLLEKPSVPSRFHELAEEEDQLPLLRMALLLHDLGKGTTPGDHVRGSVEAAAAILTRLHAPEADANTIQFLIENHLVLSSVMTGRDLDDPATARFLSARVGTHENLRKLTLLTYADVSAVNPTAMSPWRSEQLWHVYAAGAAQLTRELDSDRIGKPTPDLEVPALRPELARFLRGFPTRYLRVHSTEQIEDHFRLEQLRLKTGVALEICKVPGAYAATILAADHPGLFCDLCGALASFGLNIVKAEAASNADSCALDEFHFTDPSRTLELNPEEFERLRSTLSGVTKGSLRVTDLLKRRRPPRLSFPQQLSPSVRFDNLASDSATLLHFTGADRPGLLYDLSSALTGLGCDIELVLVDTEGHRAIDVFYVTKEGGKLDPLTQQQVLRKIQPTTI